MSTLLHVWSAQGLDGTQYDVQVFQLVCGHYCVACLCGKTYVDDGSVKMWAVSVLEQAPHIVEEAEATSTAQAMMTGLGGGTADFFNRTYPVPS